MGLVSRYQFPSMGGPFSIDGVDPRTGQPLAVQRQPAQPQSMAPMPTAAPRAPAQPQPMFGQPMQMPQQPMMPVPQFQMPQVDPSIAAYGAQMGGSFSASPQMNDPNGNGDAAMQAYRDRQPQAGDMASGTVPESFDWMGGKPFGGALGETLGNFNGMDMLSMGLSLLGNAQNGGDWGQVGQDLMSITQGAEMRQDRQLARSDREREIKRQEEADKRTAELFGYQVDELKAGQEERAYAKANRERLAGVQQGLLQTTTDPALRAALESMPPEQFGEFLGNRILRQEDVAARQAEAEADRAFRSSEAAKDRSFQERLADIRKKDPMQTVQGKASIAAIEPFITAAGNAGPALRKVERMKEIIGQLHQMGGTNQPIDANTRIFLSRLSGNGREAQALMEEYKNLAIGFTLEEVQKLRPASNLDVKMIQESLPNADNNPYGAMNMLNRMERELKNAVKGANDRINWVEQGYSIYGTNEQGQTFFEAHPDATTAGLAPAEASTAAPKATPKVGEKRTGADGKEYLYVGGDPNDPRSWQTASTMSPITAARVLNGGVLR